MKLITKIHKADFLRKTELWNEADLSVEEKNQTIQNMVLSLPKGYYKIHDREHGTNIVDAVYEMYGWMPSVFVNESMMLGLQCLYPQKVYASFTLGLDVIELK